MVLAFIERKARNGRLTLMSTQIIGNIIESFCSVQVTQRFVNQGPETECALLMRGTDGYVIYDIEIIKGHERLAFNIRGFDDGQLTRIGAYNTMAFGKSTNDILLNIGNIAQQDIVQVTFGVSFVGNLSSPTTLLFTLPFHEFNANTSASLEIDVRSQDSIESVTTGSIKSNFDSLTLRFANEPITDSPVVTVQTRQPYTSRGIAVTVGDEQYIGLSIVPELSAGHEVLTEAIFMLDSSGSMTGAKMAAAKNTLEQLVSSLPGSCCFNVVAFESGHKLFWNESQRKTDGIMAEFRALLAGVSATGGTCLLSPLRIVYGRAPLQGYVRQIFVLTDGQVSDEADVLALVAQHRDSQRVFSVGIGSDVARAFIEEIATRSTGNAAFVDADDVRRAAAEQLRHALKPAVASPEIHASDDDAVEVSPFPIPPFFSNSITHVFLKKAHAADGVSVLVSGQSGSATYESVLPITPVPDKIHLRKFHAFHNIKDLQDRIPLASPEQARELKSTIVSISQATGILSDFTAMFTVLEGADMHFQPSLGQDRFRVMQPFTQGQCRGQERFVALDRMMARQQEQQLLTQEDRIYLDASWQTVGAGGTFCRCEQTPLKYWSRRRITVAAIATGIIILILVMVLLGVFVF